MNILDLAIARKSVRTFDGNKISNEEINKILEYCKTIKNPYNIPVELKNAVKRIGKEPHLFLSSSVGNSKAKNRIWRYYWYE